MNGIDLYDAYARTMVSRRDGMVCWWYAGVLSAHLDGLIGLPCVGSQTIMAMRVRHVSPDAMRIDWTELVLLRDLMTGKPVTDWQNPITGQSASLKSAFRDGPVTYHVSRAGAGLNLRVEQPGAIIIASHIDAEVREGQVIFTQTEVKERDFAQHTTAKTSSAAHLVTRLMFTASLQELSADVDTVSSSGCYDAQLDGMLSGWMDFGTTKGTSSVRGIIRKATPDQVLDPETWAFYQQTFPDFFHNGRVSPAEWR